MKKKFVIAIDGASASGKSALAKKIAEYYKGYFLLTGNLYRVVAKKVIAENIDVHDIEKLKKIISLISEEELLDKNLYTNQIADTASKVAVVQKVREELNKFQRKWIKSKNIAIVEGRDIGTVIYPNADAKIFLTSSLSIRAKRRQKDLSSLAINVSYEDVFNDLELRDKRDSSRENAPLKKADDAEVLDSTNLTIDQTVDKAIEIIEKEIDKQC